MDIEGNTTYQAYMSYYLDKDKGEDTKKVTGDKSGKAPAFVDMPITNVTTPEVEDDEQTWTAKSGSLRMFVALSTMALLAANML